MSKMPTTPATSRPHEAPNPFELVIVTPETLDPALSADIKQWAEINHVPAAVTDPAAQKSIRNWGLPWFRAGAVVVNGDGQILMVHEGRVQVKKIKDEAQKAKLLSEGHKPGDWVDGDGGWNLPAGRLNSGETFEDGAEREVGEESGWHATVRQYLCLRTSEKPDNQYIMPVFLADANYGPAEFHTTATRETLEIAWLTPEEIWKLYATEELRSPEFVVAALEAYEKSV